MTAFAVFIALRLVMVLHPYAGRNLSNIVFGTPNGNHTATLGMDKTEQTARHNCIQGWTGITEWGGTSLQTIVDACKPLATARYMAFHSYQHGASSQPYYETINVRLARKPQFIVAYEMNWQPLPERHGAPLRLRAETQVGFKMVKWLRAIEFVEAYRQIRGGDGGSREDISHHEQTIPIEW